MKHRYIKLVLFTGGGFLFIWLDIMIGHLGGGMGNPFMWTPLLVLPAAAGSALLAAVRDTASSRGIFVFMCWLVVLAGLMGFGFHVSRLVRDLSGQTVEWKVLARLMRYPPLLAPLSVSALGVLGLLVGGESKQNLTGGDSNAK